MAPNDPEGLQALASCQDHQDQSQITLPGKKVQGNCGGHLGFQ